VTQSNALTYALSVNGEVVDSRYCGAVSETSDVASLFLKLKLSVRNVARSPMILARNPGTGSPKVVVDPEHGTGTYDIEDLDRYVVVGEVEKPAFGSTPSAREFVVLRPSEQYATQVEVAVIVRRRGRTAIPNTVVEGARYLLRAPIYWSTPFFALTDQEILALKARWRPFGDLVVGASVSNWIEFQAPALVNVTTCGQQ
jgi:hypothetical protein